MSFAEVVARARMMWYRRLWSCADVSGAPELRAPVVLAGAGHISFDGHVILGWEQGPAFFSGYSYIEARHPHSHIRLGAGTHLNNAVTIVSDGAGITLGERCLLGPMVQIYDSDFHPLDPERRATDPPLRAEVRIGDDVFIGSSAIILKGVTIGAGSVIGAGAVIARDVPARTTVAGDTERRRLIETAQRSHRPDPA
jgi:acetyltransferase-like isoleucine patch superfamily enzyme